MKLISFKQQALWVLFLIFLILLPSFTQETKPENEAPVERGLFSTSIRVTGKVIPLEGAMFVQAARVTGRLLEILKHEGEHVSVGDPIYRISSAECASLSGEAKVAKERQLGDMMHAVKKRQARLDLKLDNEDCLLLASFSGVITRRFLEPGANFNIGDPLAHVVDPGRVTIELDVPEKDSARVSVGNNVIVRVASSLDPELKTKVQTVVPALDPMTRTTRVRVVPILFKHPPAIESFVTAEIETDAPEQTLIVPSASLVFYQGKQWVLKTRENEKPLPVAIEVLSDAGEKSSVRPLNGYSLTAGDKVLTKGAVFAFKQLRNEAK